MLEMILADAVPLKEKVTLSDPYGWGTEWEIYRLDATGYQAAEDEANPQLKMGQAARSAARKAARRANAETKGRRRGQGGALVGVDEEQIIEDAFTDEMAAGFTEPFTLQDKIPAIAAHLCKVKVFPEDGKSLWDFEGDPAELHILSTAPKEPGSVVPLSYPAAFKGDGDWRNDGARGLEYVWHIEDAKDLSEREQVPYGGFGWEPGLAPTLNIMLALWILDISRTTEIFEPVPGEIEEGIKSIRPTQDGAGSSSDPEAQKTDAR